MPVSADVMQIVQILEEEVSGALAGELLMEINLGREPKVDDGDGVETMKSETSAEDDFDSHGRPSREPNRAPLSPLWRDAEWLPNERRGRETAATGRKPSVRLRAPPGRDLRGRQLRRRG